MENLPKEPQDLRPTSWNLELAQLDLRFQGHRLRVPRLEERLLCSIAQEDIREPLGGVLDASGASHPPGRLQAPEVRVEAGDRHRILQGAG